MSLPSCQEKFRSLEILIHCWQARLSARDWRLLRSGTEPSFSQTQSFQGLEMPESGVFFRSCMKETGLWRALGLGAACPTALWSLVTTLCASLLKTWTPKKCPKIEILGFIKADKKLDSFIGTCHFFKIYKFWQKKPHKNQNQQQQKTPPRQTTSPQPPYTRKPKPPIKTPNNPKQFQWFV